jgi:beta-galactosidase/beta-glucuronidase
MPDMSYPADHIRHNSEGVGWYRKAMAIPEDWRGNLVWLVIGEAIRYADVYVNGGLAGGTKDSARPSRFEISRHQPGSPGASSKRLS